jgi:hypothetical protein
MAGFSHAGNNNPPGHPGQKANRLAETFIQPIGQGAQGIGFQRQNAAGRNEISMGAETIHATFYEVRNLRGQ